MDATSASPALAEFNPTHLILLSELGHDERDRYLNWLLDNEIIPEEQTDGGYIATVRVLAPGVKKPPSKRERSTVKKTAPSIKDRLRQLSELQQLDIMKTLGMRTVNGTEFDCTQYPRFSAFLSNSDCKPKLRTVAWVMKMIESIYDSRYAQDKAELQKEDLDDDAKTKPSLFFPIFVV